MIIRKVDNALRMMEIINSMKKPQIKYQIERCQDYTRVNLAAINENGICLYKYYKEMRAWDTDYINDQRAMVYFGNLPTKIFRKYFETHDGVIDPMDKAK